MPICGVYPVERVPRVNSLVHRSAVLHMDDGRQRLREDEKVEDVAVEQTGRLGLIDIGHPKWRGACEREKFNTEESQRESKFDR